MPAANGSERRLDFRLQFPEHDGIECLDLHGSFPGNKRTPPRTGTIIRFGPEL
jgi:hypothetical protein